MTGTYIARYAQKNNPKSLVFLEYFGTIWEVAKTPEKGKLVEATGIEPATS